MKISKTDIRLIALDLDGTLLNSEKRLTERSRAALTAAAERGVEIVPATGRFFRGMPEAVRALPFLRYAITINGAHVLSVPGGETIYSAEIPLGEAVECLSYLDTLPVIYDCYMEGWGYITAAMRDRAEEYISYAPSLQMMRELRVPVPELKAFLLVRGRGVQKLQLFTRDIPLRDALILTLKDKYPGFSVTASLPNNIELNAAAANKGDALAALAAHLGLTMEQTMAFGDGLNDLSMLRAAGTGVAMGNGHPDVKAAADLVTGSCDEDGVAAVIERMMSP